MNDIDGLLLELGEQEIISTGPGLRNVNGREDAALLELPVQDKLHVAGALEFLIDHIIHAGAGVHQGGGQDGQGASLPHIAGRTEEALRHMKCGRVETTGQGSSGWRNNEIIGTGQAGDGVEKDGDILALLHKALRAFNGHLGHALMMLWKLVEGRINDCHETALNLLLHIRDLLWPLINEKNEKMHLRFVLDNGLRHLLKERGLTSLRRRNDHATLALSDRGQQVQNAEGRRRLLVRHLEADTLVREDRCQGFKAPPTEHLGQRLAIHGFNEGKGCVALGRILRSGKPLNHVARLQAIALNDGRIHVDIAVTRHEVRRAREAEAIRHDLQDASTRIATWHSPRFIVELRCLFIALCTHGSARLGRQDGAAGFRFRCTAICSVWGVQCLCCAFRLRAEAHFIGPQARGLW